MTPPTDLSKTIISELENKQVAPKPRWHFLVRNSAMWAVGGLSVLVGGAAVSVIIYMLQSNDWDLFEDSESRVSLILGTLPYFWAVILVVMVSIALYNVKHSKTGYKYHAYTIVLGSIVLSCVLGVVLSAAGAGKAIDKVLEQEVSIYSEFFFPKAHQLTQPEEGRLAGIITSVESNEIFYLIDIHENEWQVIADAFEFDYRGEDDENEIEEGHLAIIKGEMISDAVFEADKIRIKDEDDAFGPKGKLPRRKPGQGLDDYLEEYGEHEYKEHKPPKGSPLE